MEQQVTQAQVDELEMQIARLQKDNKELKSIINSTTGTTQKTSEEIFESFHEGDQFFRHKNGTLMNNVEVCQKLYEYGKACERENKSNPFSKEVMDFLNIANDTSLPVELRNAKMKMNITNDLGFQENIK